MFLIRHNNRILGITDILFSQVNFLSGKFT